MYFLKVAHGSSSMVLAVMHSMVFIETVLPVSWTSVKGNFFLCSQYLFQSVMFKLQACLFFHILFQKKQSHCINRQRLTVLNLPGSQNRSKYQCVFVALQRSIQCHLQCISMFGNVAFNLFQPMKWIRWLTSLHGS